MTDTKLLPCPFCAATGSDVEVMIESSYYMVGCNVCGCTSRWSLSRNEVIAAWNRRDLISDKCFCTCDACKYCEQLLEANP